MNINTFALGLIERMPVLSLIAIRATYIAKRMSMYMRDVVYVYTAKRRHTRLINELLDTADKIADYRYQATKTMLEIKEERMYIAKLAYLRSMVED